MTLKTKPSTNMLSIGEVAKRSGIPISTIHFYESKGLIKSVRTTGNQRRFHPLVLRCLAIVKVAQLTGIGLDDIQDTLGDLPASSKVNKDEWERISSCWRDTLDKKINRLIQLRDKLNSCIGCGCLSTTDCPLRNPNDILGQEGSGARLLEP